MIILSILSLTVFILILSHFFLIKNISFLKREITSNNLLLADLEIKTTDIHCSLGYPLETFQQEIMVQLLHIEAMIVRKENPIKESVVRSNRRPRTQEQKEMASKIAKERWAKIRQEQKRSAPDAIEFTQTPVFV